MWASSTSGWARGACTARGTGATSSGTSSSSFRCSTTASRNRSGPPRLPVAPPRRGAPCGEGGGAPRAMYPWQSASDGRDETPNMLFNSRSARWMPDRSSRQRHVGLAVAYELWQHWQSTGDTELFLGAPSEVLFEIARFFTSLATFDEAIGRYRIRGVMGPDEFHDGYPGRWRRHRRQRVHERALRLAVGARPRARRDPGAQPARRRPRAHRHGPGRTGPHGSGVTPAVRPFHEGVISQFDGYEKLLQFDFERYRAQYGNLGRLDLILESEGDSPTTTRWPSSPTRSCSSTCSRRGAPPGASALGYELAPETLQRTIEYYEERSTQGSTLARVVHAWVSARADRADSWRYFDEALSSDIADIQGGTTREGSTSVPWRAPSTSSSAATPASKCETTAST